MLLGGVFESFDPFAGGLHWQAAAYAVWESFFCVGICLGLLTMFRERYDAQGGLARFLAANAFGVYVFHTPILVAMTMAAREVTVHPLVKMIVMAGITLPVCFGASWLIRRVPILRRIFS